MVGYVGYIIWQYVCNLLLRMCKACPGESVIPQSTLGMNKCYRLND